MLPFHVAFSPQISSMNRLLETFIQGVSPMPKNDVDTRALMVLERESARMHDAAERVRLVVRAMALRRGIRPEPHAAAED
jgi:hypothetical protein